METAAFLYAVSLSDEESANILNENPAIQAQREQLVKKRDRITQSLAELKKVAPEVVARARRNNIVA